MLSVLTLVFAFETLAALAYAFGMAVTGTITIITLLFFYIVWRHWGTPLWLVVAGGAVLLLIDLLFLTAPGTHCSSQSPGNARPAKGRCGSSSPSCTSCGHPCTGCREPRCSSTAESRSAAMAELWNPTGLPAQPASVSDQAGAVRSGAPVGRQCRVLCRSSRDATRRCGR
jgi:hypothetical protein